MEIDAEKLHGKYGEDKSNADGLEEKLARLVSAQSGLAEELGKKLVALDGLEEQFESLESLQHHVAKELNSKLEPLEENITVRLANLHAQKETAWWTGHHAGGGAHMESLDLQPEAKRVQDTVVAPNRKEVLKESASAGSSAALIDLR